MSKENERYFKKSDKCCHTCNKLHTKKVAIVRNRCDTAGDYRGSIHQSCNANFWLTKRIPVIYHNLKGYDRHLIMQEIGTFDQKKSIMLNGIEKYIASILEKN